MKTKYLNIFLWSFLVIMSLCGIYFYGIILKANGDNVEHLHSSWLIWMGYIPYKDFFQHHNPLMWYLSAPFVAGFIDNIHIFAIFNCVGVVTLLLMTYYQAKILRISGAGYFAALFNAAIMISSYSILWSTDYRPDTFMYLSLFVGLYYLFIHIEKQNLASLVVSFLCFFLSFMFTQKVLLSLIIPAGYILYWLYCRKINIKNFLYASILPILLLGSFLCYLYFYDALDVYWRSNFLFNTHIPEIFSSHRIIFPPFEYIDFYFFIPLGSVAAIYFLYRGNYIEVLLSLIFVEETFLRLFYFSGFLHYSIFWLIIGIMLTVLFLDKFTQIKPFVALLGCVYLLFMLFYNYFVTYKREIIKYDTLNGHELAFHLLTPCDYAINGYYSVYNLKAKDAGYYAILLGQIDVLGEKVGIAHRDNLNELIRTKKPKIISGEIYWDTYWEERGKKIAAHKIEKNLLDTYYDYSGMGNIFVLKPQFQKHQCVYNGKDWKFMD
ncbi:MAG: glycosyltransferase family 39 protein [Acetobacter sp.]|nr:glycosyltransferase family 39 protein [Acetobacter sp.]